MSNTHWEEWELRYEHSRDLQAAQCLSLGLPVPKEKEYGTLKLVKGLWRKFAGRLFWDQFMKMGHNTPIFDGCKCRDRRNKPKEIK